MGLATGVYAISFGALSVASGLSLWQTIALSALMFTGGSQYAFIGIVGAGGSGISAVAASSLLGLRNGLYALQLGTLLDVRSWRRALAAHLTIDESTAMAVGQPTTALARVGFWWTGAAVFVLWNALTIVGALIGDVIGDPRTYGLDAAAAAAFCGLLWPRLVTTEARVVAAVGAVLALLVAPVVPAGVPVLVVAVATMLLGVLPQPPQRPREERA